MDFLAACNDAAKDARVRKGWKMVLREGQVYRLASALLQAVMDTKREEEIAQLVLERAHYGCEGAKVEF